MNWLPSRHVLPWWLLIVSLAFNVGFGATYGVRSYTPATPANVNGDRGGGHRSRFFKPEDLNLSADQQEAMEQNSRALRERVDEFRMQMHEARQSLTDLLIVDEPDTDAIAAQLDVTSDIQRLMQQAVVEHLMHERQLLEPEQRQRFDEMIRHRIFPGGRFERGRGGGRGAEGGPGRGGERGPWRGRGANGERGPDGGALHPPEGGRGGRRDTEGDRRGDPDADRGPGPEAPLPPDTDRPADPPPPPPDQRVLTEPGTTMHA